MKRKREKEPAENLLVNMKRKKFEVFQSARLLLRKIHDNGYVNLCDNNVQDGELTQHVIWHWVCAGVKDLDLAENELTTLPIVFGSLYKMEFIRLSKNHFKEIPPSLFSLTKLETLHLSRNCIKSVSAEIGRLKKLRVLHLSENQIEELPEELFQLKNLEVLDVKQNKIRLLPYMDKAIGLHTLHLDFNKLLSLPEKMPPHLEVLTIQYNQLYELPNMLNLKKIDWRKVTLNGNWLSGVPDWIEQNFETFFRPQGFEKQRQIKAECADYSEIIKNLRRNIDADTEIIRQLQAEMPLVFREKELKQLLGEFKSYGREVRAVRKNLEPMRQKSKLELLRDEIANIRAKIAGATKEGINYRLPAAELINQYFFTTRAFHQVRRYFDADGNEIIIDWNDLQERFSNEPIASSFNDVNIRSRIEEKVLKNLLTNSEEDLKPGTEIRQSGHLRDLTPPINENGLYSTKIFVIGDVIGTWKGATVYTNEECEKYFHKFSKHHDRARYLLQVPFVRGSKTVKLHLHPPKKSGSINDFRFNIRKPFDECSEDERAKRNVIWILVKFRGSTHVVELASREISAGEELLTYYGSHYLTDDALEDTKLKTTYARLTNDIQCKIFRPITIEDL